MEDVNWKRMYTRLANAISDALDIMSPIGKNEKSYRILKQALLDAEEMYISAGSDDDDDEE